MTKELVGSPRVHNELYLICEVFAGFICISYFFLLYIHSCVSQVSSKNNTEKILNHPRPRKAQVALN